MKQKVFEYVKNNVTYLVHVTYKYQRGTYFYYKKDGFYVTTPYLTSTRFIVSGIDKFFDKLIDGYKKTISHFSFEEDFIYLLGEKVTLSSLNIKDIEELRAYLKSYALDVITKEVRKYEEIMEIRLPYKVKVKDTVRQYGSNSKKTHTLSFQISLIHYSLDIIDTVVVHELAHEFERNHQKGFYDVVYRYSPNYKFFQRKLKKGIHQ